MSLYNITRDNKFELKAGKLTVDSLSLGAQSKGVTSMVGGTFTILSPLSGINVPVILTSHTAGITSPMSVTAVVPGVSMTVTTASGEGAGAVAWAIIAD